MIKYFFWKVAIDWNYGSMNFASSPQLNQLNGASAFINTHFTQTHVFYISILHYWRFNLQTPSCHTRTESLLNTQRNQMHDANLTSFHVMKKWSCWLVPFQSLIIRLSPQEPVEGGWGAHKQNTMVRPTGRVYTLLFVSIYKEFLYDLFFII